MISIGGNAFSGTGWYSNQKDGLLYLDNWLLGYKGAKPTDELKVAEGTLGIADGAFSGRSDLTSITIPNSMTSIGNSAFSGCYSLQFVNFAEGCQLTNIGNEAFSNCIYLFFIAIPANVTNIGSSAFENCSCLFFVSIGSSVKSIGGSAFKDCSSLRSVSFAENSQLTTIGSCAFQNCTSLSSITIPENVTSIGNSAFRGCSGIADIYCYAAPAILEWIYAPSSLAKRDFKPNKETLCHVKTDKLDAFNEKFENVNVTFVENMYDFVVDNLRYRITNIASTDQTDNTKDANESHNTVELFGYVALPSGVVEIPAFVNHNGEEYAVTSISEGVFSGCTSLTSIMVDTENMNYSSIDGVLFDKTGITLITYPAGKPDASYTIPARVTSIGNQAFYLCEGLTSVTIPEWEINYGIGVYDWSYNVADVYCYHALPVTADEISNFSGIMTGYMIYRRTKFHVAGDVAAWKKAFPNANVTFVGDLYPMLTIDGLNYRITSEDSKTVELIGYDGTKPFGDLSIPATVNGYSVTSIGDNAFRGCVDLTSITIPVSVTSIGNDVFYGCADLKSIVVTTGNPVYDSRDNCNAIIRTQDNTLIAGCKNTVIPGSVTSIGDAAFRGCYRLTSITIPASVTSIGNYVFYNCTSLESVIFADGSQLASIGYYAFSYCQNLMSISIPDGVTNINDHTFYSCTSLTLVNIPANVTIIDYGAFEKCTSLTSINFTENSQLTSIGSYAFRNCTSLTSLNIPDGVTNISWEAFMSCTGLTSVVIPSSVISIGWLAFYGCTEVTDVYCYADPSTLTWSLDLDFKPNKETLCHVKADKLDAYNEKFPNVNVTFVGDLVDSIEHLTADSKDVQYIQMNGMITNELKHGLNIIRISDGTTKKVWVK